MWRIHKSRTIRKKTLAFLLLCVLTSGLGLYSYRSFAMPLPLASVSTYTTSAKSSELVPLPWPEKGQAAIGSLAEGVLARSSTDQNPQPIASIAKILTALAVLDKKPQALNDDGPSITLGRRDVDIYKDYIANGGSAVKVEENEVLSLRQILEGTLLPSANNLADSMAIWAFGSLENYTEYANKLVSSWELHKTTVRDASGFSDTTTSTVDELVRIGQKAMSNPVLANIVQKKEATLPVAGVITNTNILLANGATGIKTGHTDKAGACLLFATNYAVTDSATITVIGAVLGQSDMSQAFAASGSIISASKKNFGEQTIVAKGERVASYRSAWGSVTGIVANEPLTFVGWKASNVKVTTAIKEASTVKKGEDSGVVSISFNNKTSSVAVSAENDLGKPSIYFRLRHGLSL